MSGPAATGTFYSIELTPTVSSGVCSAALAIKKTVSGSVTTLVSSSYTCESGMTLRADIIGTYIGLSINNRLWVYATDSSITSGKPGVGAFGTPSGNSVAGVSFGGADRIAPSTISSSLVSTFVLPTSVNLRFPGFPDDTNGSGVALYQLYRNPGAVWIGSSDQPEFTDTTVTASTSYTYLIYALDYFNNWSSAVSVGVTTLPSSSPDPRRVGVRPTGAYWGASPEQIDLLSGNLNFSIPLLNAQGRNGWSVPFNLTYNSQNWREDMGGTWNLGMDVGYGYGWKLMAGSLTAFYADWLTVDHYQFVDASGAEYRLDQNSGGIWSSLESIYVWFDSNANVLHFRDGSFWVMGCISGGTEADAGTMYPSVMEDSNGNQIMVRYYAGAGLAWTNSSARIQEIEDVRAVYSGSDYKTYTFTFNTVNSAPHLQQIANTIGTSEGYTFGIASQSLQDPINFTSFPGTTGLNSITISGIGTQYNFTYDGSGEMTEVVLPYKGYIKWTYGSVIYSSGFAQREVQSRILSKDGSTQTTYSFFHESSSSSVPVHQCTILDDPGLVGEKYWGFNTSGTYVSLVSEYQGRQVSGAETHSGCSSESPSPTVLTESDFTWSQSSGQSYISSTLVTANSVQSKTTQTVDGYGNVTQVVKYNYGNLTSAYRTFNYYYLTSSPYTTRYIYNRLTSSTVTVGLGTPTTLNTISYDPGGLTSVSPTPREWDSAMASAIYRGDPSTISDPSNYTTIYRNITGATTSITVNGISTSVSTSTTTNYAAPEQLTVGSLTNTNTYNSFLGLTNETGPNSSSIAIGYDSYARPTSSTSPFGATASTAYYDTATPPYIYSTTTASSRWSKTLLDGLGRTLEVDAGDSSGTQSVAESVYGSCGCSPLGKLVQQAVPHAYGASPVHYTTYSYDGIGRTLSVQAPDGASTTTYSYTANYITVDDPASKVKTFTMDVLGNLVQVAEDPLGLNYVTTYTYDGLNHLTGVSMTRGSTTQTRTFTYSGNYLTQATNPENGTVNYTYNSYGKVATRIDAKNQKVAYTYDTYARLTEVQRYPVSTGSEDTCQRETYYYDSNPFDGGSYSNYITGRLAAVQYMGGSVGGCSTTFQEWYSYGIPGAPVGKKLRAIRTVAENWPPGSQTLNVDLNGTFSYDTEGKMTSEGYPTDNAGTTASLGMSYDTMGRLYTLTDQLTSNNIVASASYGPANELLSMTAGSYYGNWGSESRSYNAMKQLTALSSNGVSLQYNYSSSANNGKITSQYDTVSGETVAYAYDSLNRLYTAAATMGGTWSQTYAYDGFGNLTAITGTAAASYSYNSSTNQGYCADANGNTGEVSCAGFYYGNTYDVENRIVQTGTGDGPYFYSYAPGNKRVWRGNGGTVDELTFWSPSGQKLGTYALTTTAGTTSGGVHYGPYFYATQTGTNYYFGSKLIKNAGGWVYSDRLGSIGKFYPYGQERPSPTTNGTEKFTGYFRDAETGNDYAMNRYQQPGTGRFLTTDPARSSNPGDSNSWNQYAYSGGDPINRTDPDGLLVENICGVDSSAFGCEPFAGYWEQQGLCGTTWGGYFIDCSSDGGGGGGVGGGGGGGGSVAPAPSCTSGSLTNTLTSAQSALLGGTSFSSLSAAQQLVFYTVTTDAASLGVNLSMYTLGSISIAGQSGSSQTELYLTAIPGSTAFFDLKASLGSNFASAGWDPFHGGGYGAGGNWRQTTPTNSMQIVAQANGNISIDIDPNNPNLFGGGNLASMFGHLGNVIHNRLTGTDTNYNSVAAGLGIGISLCP